MSTASTMPQLPGVSAPMSRWCAVVTEKPISLSLEEHRHAEGDVRAMARAAIGVVVHDHVARPDRLAARLQSSSGCRGCSRGSGRTAAASTSCIRTAAGPSASVSAVPKSSDSRMIDGIAHSHELVAHLDGDVLQRAVDHGGGDRIDACRRDAAVPGFACLFICVSKRDEDAARRVDDGVAHAAS